MNSSSLCLFCRASSGRMLDGSIDLFKLPLSKHRQFNLKEFLGNAENQTRGCWLRSTNATSVFIFIFILFLVQLMMLYYFGSFISTFCVHQDFVSCFANSNHFLSIYLTNASLSVTSLCPSHSRSKIWSLFKFENAF